MFASLFSIGSLKIFAEATGMSPRPDPMAGTEYYEHIAYEIKALLVSDETLITSYNPIQKANSLGGSHQRKIPYLLGIALLPIVNIPIATNLIKNFLCPISSQNTKLLNANKVFIVLIFKDKRKQDSKIIQLLCWDKNIN